MRTRSRLGILAVAAAAAAGVALPATAQTTAPGAAAAAHAGTPSPANHPLSPKIAQLSNPFFLTTLNGHQFCIGAPDLNAYTAVVEKGSGHDGFVNGCRTLGDIFITSDANGNPEDYVENNNGTYLAANNACNYAEWKPARSDTGVVWIPYATNGDLYFVNRYCSGGENHYGMSIGGTNTFNDLWYIVIRGGGGYYTKMNVLVP